VAAGSQGARRLHAGDDPGQASGHAQWKKAIDSAKRAARQQGRA
jgi:hypothetical protein